MISVLTPSIRPEFLKITQETLEAQTFKDFEWLVEIGMRDRGFTLPEDYNKMLRRAKGDIIVSLQDCITIPHDSLQKISELSLQDAKLGLTFPVGKKPQFFTDGDAISYDWRKYREKKELTGNQWEIDFAVAPKALFFDIGGFDENFRSGWGWDNVEVGWRAVAAGYRFEVSRETEGIAIDHDKIVDHPWRNTLPVNAFLAQETADRAYHGDFKLSYL